MLKKCSNCDVILSIRCTVGASTYQLRLWLCVTLLLEYCITHTCLNKMDQIQTDSA